MLKIKELLTHLVCTQEKINKELKELNQNLKPQLETIKINGDRISTTIDMITPLKTQLENSIYTKEQTVEAINKEIDYKNELNEIKKKYPEMLEFIELISTNYANMDKYMILDTTKMLSSEYEIKRRK